MSDKDDGYDPVDATLNSHYIGAAAAGYLSLALVNELLWGIVSAIGFIFFTGFFIARFILNVQETKTLVIITAFSGLSILVFCWLIFRIL